MRHALTYRYLATLGRANIFAVPLGDSVRIVSQLAFGQVLDLELAKPRNGVPHNYGRNLQAERPSNLRNAAEVGNELV